jgi:hypothetical protein
MAEVRLDPIRNAQAMPSWSTSDVRKEQAATPPSTTDAAEVEAASRLLEELFSETPGDERPLQPEQ